MGYEERIRNKLQATYNPEMLLVADDSEKHRGHSGYREGGQTHFSVSIRASAFNGMGRIARQRAVYETLSEEMAERVHALALSVEGTET